MEKVNTLYKISKHADKSRAERRGELLPSAITINAGTTIQVQYTVAVIEVIIAACIGRVIGLTVNSCCAVLRC